MTETRLPVGFSVRLRDDVCRVDHGRILVGGSPTRVLRISDAAVARLRNGRLQVTGPGSAQLAARLLDGNLAEPIPGDPLSPADVTVVIPVKDRPAQLDRCLAALAPLACLVVDDGSQHPEATAQVATRHGARLVQLPHNVGPAGARNQGLARVRTRYVAFVDSDVTVTAQTLTGLAGHFHDAAVVLVGPRVRGRVRSHRPRWFERYDAAASSLDMGDDPGVVRPGTRVGWIPSACLVGRVDALGDGFDASMRVGEDVDLAWRLVGRGGVVRYDPSYTADHDVREGMRGWLGRKFVYGTGGADLAARHGDSVAPAVLSPAIALAALAILLRRWWAISLALGALAPVVRDLEAQLPETGWRRPVACRLTIEGLGWAVRQESGLILRHWWPLAAVVALVSRSGRRTVVSALLVDAWIASREVRGVPLGMAMVARRFDDLAYGAGLWAGAIRRRNLRCIVVRGARR